MFTSCLEKQKAISDIFNDCPNEEAKYQKIIELGRQMPKMNPEHKQEHNLVQGCQSMMYLYASLQNGKVIFQAESDALISAGLAALLITVYSGEYPETILKCPPNYLETLGISASLTPSRANGLYSIHLKMKQETLRLLLGK
jgi:cysteine desulfuration protein SufE